MDAAEPHVEVLARQALHEEARLEPRELAAARALDERVREGRESGEAREEGTRAGLEEPRLLLDHSALLAQEFRREVNRAVPWREGELRDVFRATGRTVAPRQEHRAFAADRVERDQTEPVDPQAAQPQQGVEERSVAAGLEPPADPRLARREEHLVVGHGVVVGQGGGAVKRRARRWVGARPSPAPTPLL